MTERFLSLAQIFNNYDILDKLQQDFIDFFKIQAVVGGELEFYLSENLNSDSFFSTPDLYLINPGIKFKKEKGRYQFELELPPSTDLGLYAKQITMLRQSIMDIANAEHGCAIFDSKPYPDDFGNSLHIHLNFISTTTSVNTHLDIDFLARILCHYLPKTVDFFLPTETDYNRLDHRFMAPTHICYGGNNRTVAVRIPDAYPKRIEHRLAGSNSDPASVIYAIVQSLFFGLRSPDSTDYFEKIYGNAFDPQYAEKLVKICKEPNMNYI